MTHKPLRPLPPRVRRHQLHETASSLARGRLDDVFAAVVERDGLWREWVAMPVLPALLQAVQLDMMPHRDQLPRRHAALFSLLDRAPRNGICQRIGDVYGPPVLQICRVVLREREPFLSVPGSALRVRADDGDAAPQSLGVEPCILRRSLGPHSGR